MAEPTTNEEAARDGDGGRSVLKEALMTAMAGAIVAGIAAAAKSRHDRRSSEPGEDEEAGAHEAEESAVEQGPERTEPRAGSAEGDMEEVEAADEDSAQPEAGGEQGNEPRSEDDTGEEAEGADEDPGRPESRSEEGNEPRSEKNSGKKKRPRGAASGDAKGVVDEARRQLQEVLSVEPESVSGVRRSEDGWAVTAEVVEVHRVPDSTDVLASYEVTLDDARNLVGVDQTRRYLRSQVEGGR
jgi:hypothetical protein